MGHLSFKNTALKRLFRIRRKQVEGASSPSSLSSCSEPLLVNNRPSWKCFSYEEIYIATNGFHQENLVGKGGYAEVFKGVLLMEENGERKFVAVKRLARASTSVEVEQKEKEFLSELGTIGHVRHPNISTLLGCCIHNEGLHLIFEFSSNGSVSSHLHDEKLAPAMSWMVRYKIVIGTAVGLAYLHKGCQRRIIHRDIKASNILLTQDFNPQISDFGLATWLPDDWTHRAVAPIQGTLGYLAPEYFMHGIVDEKTDVFAFGVFVLEIISGRRPVDASHRSIIAWAKPYLRHGGDENMERLKLLDPRLRQVDEKCHLQQLSRLVFIASLCIRSTARWRPSMSEILELIAGDDAIMQQERWKQPEPDNEDSSEEFWWGVDEFEDELEEFQDYCDDDDCSIHPDTSFSSLSTSTTPTASDHC